MRNKLNELISGLLILLALVMVASALLQVFARTADLNVPFTEELTIYAMIWVTFFGSSYVFGLKKHIAIDLITPSLSPSKASLIKIVIEGVVIVFSLLILIIGGSRFVWVTFKLGQVSSVMHIPKGWIYLAVPINGLLIIFYSILNIIDQIKLLKENQEV